MRKKLRSGYTTGACAAAAAKAAATLLICRGLSLFTGAAERQCDRVIGNKGKDFSLINCRTAALPRCLTEVEIPFPDGSRVNFRIFRSGINADGNSAWASVIKDAGDDPDVTNGAEITAEVTLKYSNESRVTSHKLKDIAPRDSSLLTHYSSLVVKGGKGVGRITKPGLSVGIGEAAINPVPQKMIRQAVLEAVQEFNGLKVQGLQGGDCPRFTGAAVESGLSQTSIIEITISVKDGEKLAKKTLNYRLGITGGISILGTTGIVRPISSEAWTATIAASMDIAKAMGHKIIVLSAGRASEKAHIKKYNYPEESYVMMGDYLEFALLEAEKHRFKKIHICAQWAKMLKIAMATPQTHVKHGAINIKKSVEFLEGLCQKSNNKEQSLLRINRDFNTAREIFDFINLSLVTSNLSLFSKVCSAAKKYTEGIASGIPVTAHLVSYEEDIIAGSE